METETETQNIERFGTNVDEIRTKAEHWVQEKPTDAMVAAAGIGFLVALLPLGKILRAILGLALTLLKPTLLVMGVMKIVEEMQAGAGRAASEDSTGDHP